MNLMEEIQNNSGLIDPNNKYLDVMFCESEFFDAEINEAISGKRRTSARLMKYQKKLLLKASKAQVKNPEASRVVKEVAQEVADIANKFAKIENLYLKQKAVGDKSAMAETKRSYKDLERAHVQLTNKIKKDKTLKALKAVGGVALAGAVLYFGVSGLMQTGAMPGVQSALTSAASSLKGAAGVAKDAVGGAAGAAKDAISGVVGGGAKEATKDELINKAMMNKNLGMIKANQIAMDGQIMNAEKKMSGGAGKYGILGISTLMRSLSSLFNKSFSKSTSPNAYRGTQEAMKSLEGVK